MSQTRTRAAVGSVLFFLVAPGVVAGLVPWLLTSWRTNTHWLFELQVIGWVLVGGGLVTVVSSFVQFVIEGRGTPAPVAPTEELVVGGLYRWVRNPMYLAVGAMIAGQALILGRASVFVLFALFTAAVIAFVIGYEQPTLHRRYGRHYDEYRAAVPGWWPRLSPWSPSEQNAADQPRSGPAP